MGKQNGDRLGLVLSACGAFGAHRLGKDSDVSLAIVGGMEQHHCLLVPLNCCTMAL